jgi:hypothetical protein|nr:MAG TPA: hypothetical protein [Caudoviricetes sp.]
MKKFLFECDFENGTERFDVVGLDLDHILAILLRPINLFYSNLLQNRPDLAKAVRMELITHMLDPQSPIWTERDRKVKINLFVLIDKSKKGGGS